jgi:hypothetical protein
MAEERSETRIMESPPAGAADEGAPQAPLPPASSPVGSSRAPVAATAHPSAPSRDAFAPPSTRRRGLAASRRALPTIIVFSVIVADAAALVIYFIAR